MKVYLAGPMSRVPRFNYPAFHAAAAKLRALGHEVFSPAEKDVELCGGRDPSNPTGDMDQLRREHGLTLRKCLEADLAWICSEAEAIALLPGWENSKGATAELAVARALGLDVIKLEEPI